MTEQKRFQKKALNKDDHKAAEKGAKIVKGGAGAVCTVALAVLKKDNLEKVVKGLANVGKVVIKR